jgi:iron complex outermembrane receptor protein
MPNLRPVRSLNPVVISISGVLALVCVASSAGAQSPPQTLKLPAVTVVAEKEPMPADRVAASVTAVPGDMLEGFGITTVSDASRFAPNTFYSDLSARKISNARFRGIGSSPANPGVTTFIDGVPQLNANTANIELLDVGQVEFVRGAQSALFGRNTLGGVVNVTTRLPGLSAWGGHALVPIGSYGERSLQARVAGPVVADRIGAGFAMSVGRRDGFTRNAVTGHRLDDRDAFAAKGQVYFKSSGPWQAHVVLAGERDRDGDYTLGDLASIRSNPFTVMRDFEGQTERNILSTAFTARREGSRVIFSSTTGIVDWDTRDTTDLDYTPFPAVTRDNREEAVQFTQEVRFASAPSAAIELSPNAKLAWQAGFFTFTQGYKQDAINAFSPFVLSPFVPIAVANHSPQSQLDDTGIGAFGQATVTLRDRVDISGGVRVDRERKDATLKSFFDPVIFPGTTVEQDKTFSSVSPRVAVAFRPAEGRTIYGSAGRGFKAGGFNPASPAGSEAYDEENAWHMEGGAKALVADGRVALNAALFSIDWTDMQLNLPSPQVPGQFYIANVGGATSRGVELDVNARVHEELRVFASVGATRARFKSGSVSSGVNVADNKLPSTPAFTTLFGAEFLCPVSTNASVFVRGEAVTYGEFEYDDRNTARQGAYTLANFRGGVRFGRVSFEGWIRNAFDTRYVPIAFAYDPGSAPSGFLGEPGKPRTGGISVGVSF